MKILFVTKNSINSGYGTEGAVYRYASFMGKHDTIKVLSTDYGQKNTDYVNDLSKIGIEVIQIHRSKPPFIYPLKDLRRLASVIHSVDLVYVWEPPTLLNQLIVTLALIFRKKSVRGHHNPFFYETTPNGEKMNHPTFVKLYEKLNLLFDSFYNCNHVQNSEHYDYLKNRGFRDIIKIRDCVCLGDFFQLPKYKEFTILFLGRLNYHKGADRIQKIAEYAMTMNPDVRVKIIGSGMFEQILRDAFKSQPRVSIMGYLSAAEKNEILSRSHLMVSPTRVEAFMLTGVESLASGTPVISFKVPGPPDYIKNGINGYICESIAECNDYIREIYTKWSNGNYDILSANAIDSARLHDCRIVIDEFQAKLHEIAGK